MYCLWNVLYLFWVVFLFVGKFNKVFLYRNGVVLLCVEWCESCCWVVEVSVWKRWWVSECLSWLLIVCKFSVVELNKMSWK